MNRIGALAAASAAFFPAAAAAQPVTLEDLAQRVAALEQENEALKAQIRSLTSPAPPPPPERVHDAPPVAAADPRPSSEMWDAPFVGVNAGASRFRSDYRDNLTGAPDRIATEGFTFGAQLGRRWQSGNLVTGVELEASFPLVPDHDRDLPQNQIDFPVFQLDQRLGGRLKGSLGYASGRFLGYALAGLEVSRVHHTVLPILCSATQCSLVGEPQFQRRNLAGHLIGLGIGYRFADRYSIELEATRSSFGRTSFGVNDYDIRNDALVIRINQALR